MNLMKHNLKWIKGCLTLSLSLFLMSNLTVALADMKGSHHPDGSFDVKKGSVALLKGLYALEFPVSTKSQKAQEYFNQGLVLTYGFDHSDAEVSFLEAARHDPDLAMAYWGVAFVLGPNINAAMEDANVPRAFEMIQKALALAEKTSEKEQALIGALAKRYAPKPVKDRTPLDQAFADAMGEVYLKYAGDPDVTVIYAEALMDLHPWDYWTEDGQPKLWTSTIRKILEKSLKTHPRHPHVHHLYIHLMENSPNPEATVKSADIILNLVPASGHLVHMAGHAYYAAGLYNDCSRANEKALGVDRMLVSSFDTSGLYQLAYVPHVLHYLLASYMMEGRSTEAIHVARALAEGINPKMMRKPGMGTLQHYYLTPYYTLVRFGRWEDILKEPVPPEDLLYPRGMLHYARGMAFVRKGKTGRAEAELKHLRDILNNSALESVTIWDINKGKDLLAIAADVLTGEIAAANGKIDLAIHAMEKGIKKEMALPYDEPPPWYFPVRQALGTMLLENGQIERAEDVFRKDLQKNAENPWSLFGLTQCLRKGEKSEQAEDMEKRFRRAWARADIDLQRPLF